jgi:aminoglycoside phosphotransferase
MVAWFNKQTRILMEHLPRIFLDIEHANQVFHRLGLTCTSVQPLCLGSYSLIYVATVTDGTEYIIRAQYPWWKATKTRNEVLCIDYINRHTSIPVPKVILWNDDDSEVGCEYIVMEKIPGVNLASVWNLLSSDEQQQIITQMAEIFVQFRRLSFDFVGSFTSETNNEQDISIGPAVEQTMIFATMTEMIEHLPRKFQLSTLCGPFSNIKDYLLARLNLELYCLNHFRTLAPNAALIPKLKRYIQQFSDKFPPVTKHIPIVLAHNDFRLANIIVEGTKITGVIDWEWAGAYPAFQEEIEDFAFCATEEDICNNNNEIFQNWANRFHTEVACRDNRVASNLMRDVPRYERLGPSHEPFLKSYYTVVGALERMRAPDTWPHLVNDPRYPARVQRGISLLETIV